MKAAGIICEFNPFHNGHDYLIKSVRQDLNPDALVCVMSGNFVQRGEPAMWNKYLRAKAAVLCGADIVIELPVYAAVNCASEFARAGIAILKGLGTVDCIAFGSECGNTEILNKAALFTAMEDKTFSALFRESIDLGVSYPRAYEKALREQINDLPQDFFNGSNNILALEYLKQNILLDAGLNAYTVKRIAAGHDSMFSAGKFASASCIRQLISEEKEDYKKYIPEPVIDTLSSAKAFDSHSKDVMFQILRYKILECKSTELSEISEVSEGLENLIKKAVLSANGVEELIHSIKSKRYTYARISRIMMQILLDIKKDDVKNAALHPYARVLAFNEKGRAVMREASAKANIPIITNINSQLDSQDPVHFGLDMDCRAGDIYSILMSNNIYENADKVCNCIPCNI